MEWSKEYDAAEDLKENKEASIEVRQDLLMLAGWVGQHLKHAIGKLDQVRRLVRQFAVLCLVQRPCSDSISTS